jgi:hypothetical protein
MNNKPPELHTIKVGGKAISVHRRDRFFWRYSSCFLLPLVGSNHHVFHGNYARSIDEAILGDDRSLIIFHSFTTKW